MQQFVETTLDCRQFAFEGVALRPNCLGSLFGTGRNELGPETFYHEQPVRNFGTPFLHALSCFVKQRCPLNLGSKLREKSRSLSGRSFARANDFRAHICHAAANRA